MADEEKTRRIFIATNDSDNILKVYKLMWEDFGYQVVEGGVFPGVNPSDMLMRARNGEILNAVMIDANYGHPGKVLITPEVRDLAESVKSNGGLVILVSGVAGVDRTRMEQLVTDRGFYFFSKPFNVGDLKKLVEENNKKTE